MLRVYVCGRGRHDDQPAALGAAGAAARGGRQPSKRRLCIWQLRACSSVGHSAGRLPLLCNVCAYDLACRACAPTTKTCPSSTAAECPAFDRYATCQLYTFNRWRQAQPLSVQQPALTPAATACLCTIEYGADRRLMGLLQRHLTWHEQRAPLACKHWCRRCGTLTGWTRVPCR